MSSELCTGFSFDERLGMYLVLQSSCLSAAAVLILLGYAFARWLKRRGKKDVYNDASGSSLFRNLMIADLIQAAGSLPIARWMRDGHITAGPTCTAQAVLKQIGINGFIGLHTFSVLILGWRLHRHASKIGVLVVWVFTALVVGIPNAVHRNKVYYGFDSGDYWCWITDDFKAARIMSEYVWVWSAAFIMAILYGIMIEDDGWHWGGRSRVRPDLTTEDDDVEIERNMAKNLIFYPVVYIICFPNSLSRWLQFSGTSVPFQFTLFANSLFAFSDFAVGASPGSAVVTALPPGNSADDLPHTPHAKDGSALSSSYDPYAGGELVELNMRHQHGRENSYHLTSGGQNGQGITGNVLHQSPPTRLMSLGQSTAAHTEGTTGLIVTTPQRGQRASYRSDDDEDYGMLPN
ncbi:hypothetical protein FA13DRAFT_1749937 [Coprinellus micaceus]|uniref:Glucose receptor Git3 N-terminal domain-containing protein n=1 Tax=Coprinellus micaceus TaxID=71717 RepID=A0A4Y7RC99_COPMI|nr:hypothetical protein FA13DRAFT_1749937 [Coprinellus micaceus]